MNINKFLDEATRIEGGRKHLNRGDMGDAYSVFRGLFLKYTGINMSAILRRVKDNHKGR